MNPAESWLLSRGAATGRQRLGTLRVVKAKKIVTRAGGYFLERTDLKPGMDPEKATKLRQARLDIRESRS